MQLYHLLMLLPPRGHTGLYDLLYRRISVAGPSCALLDAAGVLPSLAMSFPNEAQYPPGCAQMHGPFVLECSLASRALTGYVTCSEASSAPVLGRCLTSTNSKKIAIAYRKLGEQKDRPQSLLVRFLGMQPRSRLGDLAYKGPKCRMRG